MIKTTNLGMAIVAASMLTACLEGGDRNSYTASVDQVKTTMIGKTNSYNTGKQVRSMKVVSASARSLSVNMWNTGSWKRSCTIRLEEIDAETTRLIPNCGDKSSGQAAAVLGSVEAEVAEHAKEILTGTPVDQKFIQTASVASSMKNLPKMQGEALAMDAEMRRARNQQGKFREQEMQNAADSAAAQDGWGSAN